MTKEETLELAAKHIARGQKLIICRLTPLPIGYVLQLWHAGDHSTPAPADVVDQPLVVYREATYDEFLANRPVEFGEVLVPREAAHRCYFYEMICE
ncbi:MAG TPA: hypothetical protein VFO27_19850 [Bryobacteraceae bacterium]|nr:hypothetical protein [Bryobacteraceae bacterium]